MVKPIYLFVEGTTDDTNGDLRQGFSKLLEQKLTGKMPRIKMGDDTKATVNKFLNNNTQRSNILLIDLDKDESYKEQAINDLNLREKEDDVFFMIQEMEAWFISQAEILDKFYGEEISKKLPKKNAMKFEHPDEVLQGITKNNQKKGRYHKVKHGVDLLKMLNADMLMEYFSEFKNLINKLS